MILMLTIENLYDISHSMAGNYLLQFEYPWQALKGIKELILTLGEGLSQEEYTQVAPQVWVHNTAKVAPTAYLGGAALW